MNLLLQNIFIYGFRNITLFGHNIVQCLYKIFFSNFQSLKLVSYFQILLNYLCSISIYLIYFIFCLFFLGALMSTIWIYILRFYLKVI